MSKDDFDKRLDDAAGNAGLPPRGEQRQRCPHPVHGYVWTTNEHGYTLARKHGSDHAVVEYDDIDPPPHHECTDPLPSNFWSPTYPFWYQRPYVQQWPVTTGNCPHCAGWRASKGSDLEAWHVSEGHELQIANEQARTALMYYRDHHDQREGAKELFGGTTVEQVCILLTHHRLDTLTNEQLRDPALIDNEVLKQLHEKHGV